MKSTLNLRVRQIPVGREGWIYLIRAVGTFRYKIGRSVNPAARREKLQAQSPYALEITDAFWSIDAAKDEKHFHYLAAEYRVRGEWFEFEHPLKHLFTLSDGPVWKSQAKWELFNASLAFLENLVKEKGDGTSRNVCAGLLPIYDYAESRQDLEFADKLVYSILPHALLLCLDMNLPVETFVFGFLSGAVLHLDGYQTDHAEDSED